MANFEHYELKTVRHQVGTGTDFSEPARTHHPDWLQEPPQEIKRAHVPDLAQHLPLEKAGGNGPLFQSGGGGECSEAVKNLPQVEIGKFGHN